jgi:hypothetical protein
LRRLRAAPEASVDNQRGTGIKVGARRAVIADVAKGPGSLYFKSHASVRWPIACNARCRHFQRDVMQHLRIQVTLENAALPTTGCGSA